VTRFLASIGVLATATAFAAGDGLLSFRFGSAATAKYAVTVESRELAGADGKQTSQFTIKTPIEVAVQSRKGDLLSLRVVSGPIVARGRSVGRAKISDLTMSGDVGARPPAMFWVLLPKAGVMPGKSWVAGFNGPSPLPAGLTATYRFASVVSVGGKRLACLEVKVTAKTACSVAGVGKLYVRLSDGVVDHGQMKFTLSYERPDPQNRSRMVVNSRVVLGCKIEP
jgi:hypothetical protein